MSALEDVLALKVSKIVQFFKSPRLIGPIHLIGHKDILW